MGAGLGHIGDLIPGLLLGEVSRAEMRAAATHLRTCPDCRDELISALSVHAALLAATRLNPTGEANTHHRFG